MGNFATPSFLLDFADGFWRVFKNKDLGNRLMSFPSTAQQGRHLRFNYRAF
jgi:hypothetical protein